MVDLDMLHSCSSCASEMTEYDNYVGYDKCEVCTAREWFDELSEVDKLNFTINNIKHYDLMTDSEIVDLYNKNTSASA